MRESSEWLSVTQRVKKRKQMFLSWIDVKACSKVLSTTQTVKLKRRAADLHTDCFRLSFFLRRSYRVRQTAGGCRQLKTFFSCMWF